MCVKAQVHVFTASWPSLSQAYTCRRHTASSHSLHSRLVGKDGWLLDLGFWPGGKSCPPQSWQHRFSSKPDLLLTSSDSTYCSLGCWQLSGHQPCCTGRHSAEMNGGPILESPTISKLFASTAVDVDIFKASLYQLNDLEVPWSTWILKHYQQETFLVLLHKAIKPPQFVGNLDLVFSDLVFSSQLDTTLNRAAVPWPFNITCLCILPAKATESSPRVKPKKNDQIFSFQHNCWETWHCFEEKNVFKLLHVASNTTLIFCSLVRFALGT